MTNSTKLTISLSVGLVLLVIAHALTLATAQRVLPRVEEHFGYRTHGYTADSIPYGGINWDTGRTAGGPVQTLPVNPSARDEIKRQYTLCPSCPPVIAQTQPSLVPSTTVSNVRPIATKQERYSIAVFVSSDQQSQHLLDWFNRDPTLQALRQKCEFQAYTPTNLLYKSRYASQVPPEAFPAMLFCDPTGGLVHSFWKDVQPANAQQLYADLKAAYELHKQVVSTRNQMTGATPQMLASITLGSDCDGPNCPTPREPWLNPDRDRVIPPLFDRSKDEPIEGILRAFMHPGEALGSIVLVVVLIIVAVVVIKRLQNQ